MYGDTISIEHKEMYLFLRFDVLSFSRIGDINILKLIIRYKYGQFSEFEEVKGNG